MKTTRPCIHETTLSFTDRTSDKEYDVRTIDLANGTFTVEASWGRTAAKKQSQIKSLAVDIDEAIKIHRRIAKEKVDRGYILRYDDFRPRDIPFVDDLALPNWSPTFVPRLNKRIDGAVAQRELLEYESYLIQPHVSGERMLLIIPQLIDGAYQCINRRGVIIYPEKIRPIVNAITDQHFGQQIVLDGVQERDGNYVVFDLLRFGGVDFSNEPYEVRLNALRELFVFEKPLTLIPTAEEHRYRAAAIETARKANRAGVVFRDRFASYSNESIPIGYMAHFFRRAFCVVRPLTSTSPSFYATMFQPVSGEFETVAVIEWPATIGGPIQEGAVLEIQYDGTNVAHHLINPVIRRIRSDISYAECSMDMLENYEPIRDLSISTV
jgi:hypothetical protein